MERGWGGWLGGRAGGRVDMWVGGGGSDAVAFTLYGDGAANQGQARHTQTHTSALINGVGPGSPQQRP